MELILIDAGLRNKARKADGPVRTAKLDKAQRRLRAGSSSLTRRHLETGQSYMCRRNFAEPDSWLPIVMLNLENKLGIECLALAKRDCFWQKVEAFVAFGIAEKLDTNQAFAGLLWSWIAKWQRKDPRVEAKVLTIAARIASFSTVK